MGTNEPGDGRYGGQGGGPDPGETRPVDPGSSYSGYREGVYGEPVPDSAYQPPASYQQPASYQPPYPPQYYSPGQYPPAPYGVPQVPPPYSAYPPPYGAYPPPYRPTSGMAVASLVFGMLWLGWLGSILALIFGYQARSQIRQSGEGGDGLAVAGIVLGWIGVGTLSLYVLLFLIGSALSGFG